jgi:hypothetical protein
MSLVLYNPLQGTRAQIPELPNYWIQVHESASAASVVSGAFTYAFSHMLGTAATRVASGTISIAGMVMASGVRYVAGDLAAEKVYRGAKTAANLVDTTGNTATHLVSAVSSTATAATVGSTFLVGKMLHQLYMGFRQKEDGTNVPTEILSETKEPDFIIYDVTNASSSDVSLYPGLSEQTEKIPPSVPHFPKDGSIVSS